MVNTSTHHRVMPIDNTNTAHLPTDGLMSVSDLAQYLAVPKATIYQWRYRGRGPKALRVGRYLRFRRSDVDRWLETRTVER